MPTKQEFTDMAEYYMADPVAPTIPGYGLNGYPSNVREAIWDPFDDQDTPGRQVTRVAKEAYGDVWDKVTEAYGYLCLFEAELVGEKHAT